jgi:glycosyltransferase involved in cell wall biosynthesis
MNHPYPAPYPSPFPSPFPSRVLITGGPVGGGLSSFAEALREGLLAFGVPAEIVPPGSILNRWRDLRNPDVLKILSTTGVFASLFARRSICVAHGFPRADVQGWIKLLAIVLSLKLANRCSQLVAVSSYVAVHLHTIFNLRVDAVIHNPMRSLFHLSAGADAPPRDCITYVGRLHPAKRLDKIFPAICSLVEETPGLRGCIIGDGVLRDALQSHARGNPRIEFHGSLAPEEVREWLRRTRIFVSGCETEALGIAYLEALSQGCVVAMPACGGGLEIASGEVGKSIRLLPLTLEHSEVMTVLREALSAPPCAANLAGFEASAIAMRYLEADLRRLPQPVLAASNSSPQAGLQ